MILFLTPQNLSIEICVQKIFYVYIYVKNALTKEKKKIIKISPAKKIFFCDIYVTYGLEGCIINI